MVLLPYSEERYAEQAEEIWDLIAEETSDVEPQSSEICYGEFSDHHAVQQLRFLAQEIPKRTDVPLRIGAATSKIVAAHAARTSGEDVWIVHPGQEPDVLASMRLIKLPGLTAKMPERFKRLGLSTVRDLQQIPLGEIIAQFGQQHGTRLHRLANGLDYDTVKPDWPKKAITQKAAFDFACGDLAIVEASLARCTANIAASLISQYRYCRSVGLVIELEDGTHVRETEKLILPTSDSAVLYRCAKRLWLRMDPKQAVSTVALSVTDIDAGSARQLTLVDDNGMGYRHEREQALASTLGHVRKRLGAASVVHAAMFTPPKSLEHFIETLTKRRSESVVVTAENGVPVSWLRQRRQGREELFRVTHIADHWQLSDWRENTSFEYYRVETNPPGLYDLRRQGEHWQLSGVAD